MVNKPRVCRIVNASTKKVKLRRSREPGFWPVWGTVAATAAEDGPAGFDETVSVFRLIRDLCPLHQAESLTHSATCLEACMNPSRQPGGRKVD